MGTIDFSLDDNKMNVDGTSTSSSPGSLSSSSSLSTATTGSTVILPSTPTPAATPLKTASPLPPSEHKRSSTSSAPSRPVRPRATSHATHLAHETPKRPPRRNKRDSAAPQDSILLGLSQDTPLVPAGGYIIYVSNSLDKTTFDTSRVPPSTYGAPPTSLPSHPAPKPFVHIEVPIFKQCSIAQFQQDERKRKMETLSKALAKEEAKAAAEALALAASHEPVAPPAPGARTVSTRLKHKEAVSHQQVSVVTATPGAYGKKSTTVVTTGAGSGTAGSHHKRVEEEDLHDEVYEKRHRKQEMLERRIKNREKEKLRHAMYQQQQVVEKLRHMDINRLIPLSAFRTQANKKGTLEETSSSSVSASQSLDDGHSRGSSQISVAAAKIMQEEYHRRLIREAEESLRRFEQLGLAGEPSTSLTDYSPFSRTKNRLLSLEVEPVSSSEPEESESEDEEEDEGEDEDQETVKHYLSEEPTPKVVRRKRTRVVSGEEEDTGRRRARKSTPSTKASTPTPRKPKAVTPVQPPRPPKPITTFIKPGSILTSGGRKSSRVALAFGEKVPMLDRVDFDLPMDDVFGPLIQARLSARGETVPGTDKDKSKSKGKVTKGRIPVQATVSTSISAKENKAIDVEESSISSGVSSELSLSSDASSLVE
ncbi:hypothetical protein BG003_009222 [Podila horticola]|nr:hypothetical protein BG003_009222 [Podila horticola]